MNYMLKLIRDMNNLTVIITTFITAFTTIYIYLSNRHKKLHENQLERVYFPIYKELEGYFYSFSDDTFFDDTLFLIAITNIEKIIKENRMIAGNILYSLFETFSENKNKKSFNKLCDHIILMYNNRLRVNGLPGISIEYIAKHNLHIKHKVLYCIKQHSLYIFRICAKCIWMSIILTIIITILLDI